MDLIRSFGDYNAEPTFIDVYEPVQVPTDKEKEVSDEAGDIISKVCISVLSLEPDTSPCSVSNPHCSHHPRTPTIL